MRTHKRWQPCWALLAMVGLYFSGLLVAQEATDKAGDLANLQGSWKLTALEIDGQRRGPSAEEQEKRLKVNDRQMQFGETAFAFEINETTDPKLFDVTLFPKQENERGFEGLYKLEKGSLTLCVYLDDGTKRRPDKFATTEGSKIILLEFQRVER